MSELRRFKSAVEYRSFKKSDFQIMSEGELDILIVAKIDKYETLYCSYYNRLKNCEVIGIAPTSKDLDVARAQLIENHTWLDFHDYISSEFATKSTDLLDVKNKRDARREVNAYWLRDRFVHNENVIREGRWNRAFDTMAKISW